jgi:hypothetical protein
MSRRSQMFAEGVQKFSWQLSTFRDSDGRERHKATCLNYPQIVGIGDSEQAALSKGKEAITVAAEKAELGTDPRPSGA